MRIIAIAPAFTDFVILSVDAKLSFFLLSKWTRYLYSFSLSAV